MDVVNKSFATLGSSSLVVAALVMSACSGGSEGAVESNQLGAPSELAELGLECAPPDPGSIVHSPPPLYEELIYTASTWSEHKPTELNLTDDGLIVASASGQEVLQPLEDSQRRDLLRLIANTAATGTVWLKVQDSGLVFQAVYVRDDQIQVLGACGRDLTEHWQAEAATLGVPLAELFTGAVRDPNGAYAELLKEGPPSQVVPWAELPIDERILGSDYGASADDLDDLVPVELVVQGRPLSGNTCILTSRGWAEQCQSGDTNSLDAKERWSISGVPVVLDSSLMVGNVSDEVAEMAEAPRIAVNNVSEVTADDLKDQHLVILVVYDDEGRLSSAELLVEPNQG